MTVKATLAYGKSFHFYHEGLDNNHVYLELEDVAYQAGYRRVMVAIPIDVWEVIRRLGAARLDLVNASDGELLSMVERMVEERMIGYERARTSDPEAAGRLRFIDAAVFGAMDDPREQQVTKGFEYYKTERERQREVTARIIQHKVLDVDTKPAEVDQ
jgi:hypothetical protein